MMPSLQAGCLYKLVVPQFAQQPAVMRGTPCYNVPVVDARFTLLQRKPTDPLSSRVGISNDPVQHINSQKSGVTVRSKTCPHANVGAAACQVLGPRRMENVELSDSAVELNDAGLIPLPTLIRNPTSSGAVIMKGSADTASSDMSKNEGYLPKQSVCLTAKELQRVEAVLRQVREELTSKPQSESTGDLILQHSDDFDDDGDVWSSKEEELKNNTYINTLLGALFQEFPYDDQKMKRTKKVVHWKLPDDFQEEVSDRDNLLWKPPTKTATNSVRSPQNNLTEEEMKRVEALLKQARQEAWEASMKEIPSPGKKRHRW
eukprot:gnl/MRDRNA2_/MRDRNA2_130130_c0_seq1.p1 gnl/MRDRNA2_/MRDRNA2_130130_c0~~gnl/MRDRNA2_/MRDRNA2_130130_c0_seq1.p1  ORF type:complete len:317 (-),score=77.64 gnl/MRDRNA2_/MRDRNA2_130130_c0_seq1:165-1115(-)